MMNKIKWAGVFAMPNMFIWALQLVTNAVMISLGVFLNRRVIRRKTV